MDSLLFWLCGRTLVLNVTPKIFDWPLSSQPPCSWHTQADEAGSALMAPPSLKPSFL